MKTTYVISAFPACGKSHCFRNFQEKSVTMVDSDSSEFSWVKDSEGNNTKERNLDFPQNYMEHIKKNIGKVDVVFVSSHEVVRKALKENNIKTILIYPKQEMKEVFIDRYKTRGNNDGFINFISSNWDDFIRDMENEDYGFMKIRLDNKNPYIDKDLLYALTDNWNGNMVSLYGNY